MEQEFNQKSKLPPSSTGARFQRSQTNYNNKGGYDTYGDTYGNSKDRDAEEEEDYRNYKEAQRREDPWQKSGGRKRDHSIGSDFDNDGNAKKD